MNFVIVPDASVSTIVLQSLRLEQQPRRSETRECLLPTQSLVLFSRVCGTGYIVIFDLARDLVIFVVTGNAVHYVVRILSMSRIKPTTRVEVSR